MFKIFKHIKSILLFRQVAKTYKEETGKGKPWYMSRRFFGVLFTTAGALALTYGDIDIDKNIVNQLTESVPALIAAGIGVYGVVMEIVGIVKREKK